MDEQRDEEMSSDDEWYNRPETFPDYSRSWELQSQGRITNEDIITAMLVMEDEFDCADDPESLLRARFAFDAAVRAAARTREKRAAADDADGTIVTSMVIPSIPAEVLPNAITKALGVLDSGWWDTSDPNKREQLLREFRVAINAVAIVLQEQQERDAEYERHVQTIRQATESLRSLSVPASRTQQEIDEPMVGGPEETAILVDLHLWKRKKIEEAIRRVEGLLLSRKVRSREIAHRRLVCLAMRLYGYQLRDIALVSAVDSQIERIAEDHYSDECLQAVYEEATRKALGQPAIDKNMPNAKADSRWLRDKGLLPSKEERDHMLGLS